MGVFDEVSAELSGVDIPAWKRELAFALASAMDDSPNASTAKELRVVMDEFGSGAKEAGDVSDDLAAKRAARRSATG